MIGQLGKLLGGGGEQGVVAVVSELLEQNGGVAGLVQKFQQGGLGELIQSWIGTGGNLPVSAAQIQALFGNETVAGIAGKLGIDAPQAAELVAQYLPGLIDQLTPDGELPAAGSDLLSKGLGAVGKLFG